MAKEINDHVVGRFERFNRENKIVITFILDLDVGQF